MNSIHKLVADNQFNNDWWKTTRYKTGDEAETLPNQGAPIQYACSVCGETYPTLKEAKACRNQPYDDGGLEVGDLVAVPGVLGVSDEKDLWVAWNIPADPTSTSHFDRAGRGVPLFVVTAKHADAPRDEHRCLVTLCSLVGGHLRVGWNPANGNGHYALFRVRDGHRCDIGSTWYGVIKDSLDKCEPCARVKKEAAELAAIGISTRNLL